MKQIWNKWVRVAQKIGNFQFTVIFSFLYFVLFTPFGKITAYFTDYLSLKGNPSWKEVEDLTSNLDKLKRQ